MEELNIVKKEEYITASALAEEHSVTMSTVRRRIQEGVLFKGAKKEKMSFGEVWKIPRSEAEAITLKELSPKLFQARNKGKIEPTHNDGTELIPKSIDSSLEARVAAIEQLLIKHLAQ